ncbi:MAG: citrate transporter [Bacteroidales bacterium]|nr:citrate transporter [Bacteroidales bacterium]
MFLIQNFEFVLFALTLLGVALFHKQTMWVALTGMALIIIYRLVFNDPADPFQLFHHLGEEGRTLVNLMGLLFGFAVLSKHFEESHVPNLLPNYLRSGWMGAFTLLVMITVLSSFLDNIAAALIGGTVALVVFRGKVHIGYVAAIVASSNAGGAGSVIGDTTTTLMWIDGVPALNVIHAYVAVVPALLVFGIPLSIIQTKYQPILNDAVPGISIDYRKIFVVALILAGAITTNILLDFPAAGVWASILIGALFTSTPWSELKNSLKGTIFLLALVFSASMMPVEELPAASWQTSLVLGFVSSVFDNIPLTKLALEQGGYDWGMLAYAVGFGGSMVWFGSSAGVAITNKFPEGRSVTRWLKSGWWIAAAYIIGFLVLLALRGWEPVTGYK